MEDMLNNLAVALVEKLSKLKGSSCNIAFDEARKLVEDYCGRYGLVYTELFERLPRGFAEGFIICPKGADSVCLVLRIKEKRVDDICVVEDVEARLTIREI